MTKLFFILVYAILFAALESTLFFGIPSRDFSTDFVLLLVIFLAISKERSILAIVLAGLVVDSISSAPIGVSSIIYTLIVFLICFLSGNIIVDFLLPRFIFVAMFCVVAKFIMAFVLWLNDGVSIFSGEWLWATFLFSAWNGLFSLVWFPVLGKLFELVNKLVSKNDIPNLVAR